MGVYERPDSADTLLRLRAIGDLSGKQDHGSYLHTDAKTGT